MHTTDCNVGGGEDAARDAEPRCLSYARVTAAKYHGKQLQLRARRAVQVQDYRSALARYQELLPMVTLLEEAGATGLPSGMSLQLLQRGVELATEAFLEQAKVDEDAAEAVKEGT